MTRGEALAIAERHAPRGSGFDRCIPTTDRIVKALRREGVQAVAMRLKGARTEMRDADRRWRAMPGHGWIHYVAWVPSLDIVLDATGAQFGMPAVRALTRDDVERDWDEVVVME